MLLFVLNCVSPICWYLSRGTVRGTTDVYLVFGGNLSDIVSFGEWVQTRRNQLRLSRPELARQIHCSPVTIKKIERDERRPSPELAQLLANHLQIPDAEQEDFVRRARGEFMPNLRSPEEMSITEAQIHSDDAEEPKHNLPLQPTPFFGREKELVEIASSLADPNCRLLTILGAGGMGKTRLSIEAANAQVENFTDGVTYVELAPLSPNKSIEALNPLVGELADALGISFYESDQPEQQLFDFLRRKEKLFVFDNFEHLLDTAVFLSNLLSHAPDVKILVTSRERLNLQQEWLFPLLGLAYHEENGRSEIRNDDAVQLFGQRARQISPSFDIDSQRDGIQRICQLVEGMPLGLELAAAWVNQLSCQEIAEEMAGELDFLTTEMRNIPDRQRSVRAVFDYSWQKLTETERDVLQKISVFRGGFERKAAKEVAGASLPTLANLVGKSLLSASPNGRYQIHELLRQFAAERLANAPTLLTETQKQHGTFYLTFVGNQSTRLPGNSDLSLIQNIEGEIDNIRVAIQHSLLHAPELFLNLAVWEVLYILFEIRNWHIEGVQTMGAIAVALQPACQTEKNEAISPQSDACFYWAMYLYGNGASELRGRQISNADEAIGQALQILEAKFPNYRKERGLFNYWLAMVEFHKAELSNAESYFMKGIELLRDTEWTDYYAVCHLIYGQLAAAQGDIEKAEKLINEGAKFVDQFDHRWLKALALHFKSRIAQFHGNYAQAEQYAISALETIEPLNYPTIYSMVLRRLAFILNLQGRIEETRDIALKIIQLADDANLPVDAVWGYSTLGSLAMQVSDYQTAMQYFQHIENSPLGLNTNRPAWARLGLGEVEEARIAFLGESAGCCLQNRNLQVLRQSLGSRISRHKRGNSMTLCSF